MSDASAHEFDHWYTLDDYMNIEKIDDYMNIGKIKELLIDSELMEAIGENAYEEDNWEPYVVKFAELIVQKCCDAIGDGDGSMSSMAEHCWRETCQIEIKQHFGLK